MAEENVQKLLDMLYEMIDEAKNAPPNVTSVVNVSSHLRPSTLTNSDFRSSVWHENRNVCPPCTKSRATSSPPSREITNHQYICKVSMSISRF